MEIRPLAPTDDREAFSSGDADLDRFFRKYAGQNQFRHHIGVTYVAVEAGLILGFVTVAAGHIEVEDLAPDMVRGLPKYPLPILKLARLAVSEVAQGQGIGGALLHAVLQIALAQATTAGCFGVMVDAKPAAVGWYRRFGFVPLPLIEGGGTARPRPEPMFLMMAEIQAANEARRMAAMRSTEQRF